MLIGIMFDPCTINFLNYVEERDRVIMNKPNILL